MPSIMAIEMQRYQVRRYEHSQAAHSAQRRAPPLFLNLISVPKAATLAQLLRFKTWGSDAAAV